MTGDTQGRLLSLMSLVVIGLLIGIPLMIAWGRTSEPLPSDHGLADLAGVPAPAAGATWECLIQAIDDAGLPGTRDGFTISPNEDTSIDADVTIERDLGSTLYGRLEGGVLTVFGLPSPRLVPADCAG